MTAYYNEIDSYCVEWLRNLITEGLIPDGIVDDRSIRDVRPEDLRGFAQCHFFAGLGGWPLSLRLAGWPDDRAAWTGSCPCQPFSVAGKKKGFADDRHLWPVWRELIRERRPATVFGEQVAGAADWLGLVRSDLEAMEYAVGCLPIQAASAGAEHLRDRYWIVGHRAGVSEREQNDESHAVTDGGQARLLPGSAGNHGVAVANANITGSQGRATVPERADQRTIGAGGVADSIGGAAQRLGRPGEFSSSASGSESEEGEWEWSGRAAADRGEGSVDLADCDRQRFPQRGERYGEAEQPEQQAPLGYDASGCDALEYVIGADGKARRVKPGIRLLAHGVPARVAKLRAFGNAIDPRPAVAFIQAASECIE